MVWTRYRIQIQDDNVAHSGSCWCFKLQQYIFYKPTLRCPVTYWLTLDCKKTKRKIAFICQAIVPHGRRALLIACSFIVSNSHILELTFFFLLLSFDLDDLKAFPSQDTCILIEQPSTLFFFFDSPEKVILSWSQAVMFLVLSSTSL